MRILSQNGLGRRPEIDVSDIEASHYSGSQTDSLFAYECVSYSLFESSKPDHIHTVRSVLLV